MADRSRTRLLCSCASTISSLAGSADHHLLCRSQLDRFRRALATGEPLLVACTQEQPLFEEIREEIAPERDVVYANIRETAGWSDEADQAGPKIQALLAEADLDLPPSPSVTLRSEGSCLIYGAGQVALDAAVQLADRLDVTSMVTGPKPLIPPAANRFPVVQGRISALRGSLGAFEMTVDGYALANPSSRAFLSFEAPKDGVASRCDIIVDLTGETPLVTAPAKRDGYLRADPDDPASVQRVLFEAIDLVGEFDKPRYVAFDRELCAHSRARKTGCTRCLDVCPAGAIRTDGDTVAIDPLVCAGCGNCAAVCPTGAASYTLPSLDDLLKRVATLLQIYREAGGERPVLLFHDGEHGAEAIGMVARFGRGLPAAVIPVAVNAVTQIGFEVLIAAFAYGASAVHILAHPRQQTEFLSVAQAVGLTETVLAGLGYGSGRVQVSLEADVDVFERSLWDFVAAEPPPPAQFLAMGSKRTLARLALDHLHQATPTPLDILPLAKGAPFGRVVVDSDGCTLCLACVGACPTGALQDNPERPQLRFQEEACIQCSLCQATCPEAVIALEPRLNFTDDVRRAILIKEEEPFACVRCGKPFGTKGSIERIVETLGAKHWMFQQPEQIERIKMCEDCRVVAQFEAKDNPFASGERPPTRTTDDYQDDQENDG
ncbi:MAG: 4Fe-4S dicluster domain-containing protein [Geminicoccaceae bacterium]